MYLYKATDTLVDVVTVTFTAYDNKSNAQRYIKQSE